MIRRMALRAGSRLLLQPWFRLTRGLTLGVRAAVIDRSQLLLVRHSYAPGWQFPGGGVERGEDVWTALARELREEAGIVPTGRPILHGLFSNHDHFAGDHIACFIVQQFRREPVTPSAEIAEARFFDIAALPDTITGGTRRRIAEILDGAHPAAEW